MLLMLMLESLLLGYAVCTLAKTTPFFEHLHIHRTMLKFSGKALINYKTFHKQKKSTVYSWKFIKKFFFSVCPRRITPSKHVTPQTRLMSKVEGMFVFYYESNRRRYFKKIKHFLRFLTYTPILGGGAHNPLKTHCSLNVFNVQM